MPNTTQSEAEWFSINEQRGFEGPGVNDAPVERQSRPRPSPQARIESHRFRHITTWLLIQGWVVFFPKGLKTLDIAGFCTSFHQMVSPEYAGKANDSGRVGSSPQNPTPPASFCQMAYMLCKGVSPFIRRMGQRSAHDGIVQPRAASPFHKGGRGDIPSEKIFRLGIPAESVLQWQRRAHPRNSCNSRTNRACRRRFHAHTEAPHTAHLAAD